MLNRDDRPESNIDCKSGIAEGQPAFDGRDMTVRVRNYNVGQILSEWSNPLLFKCAGYPEFSETQDAISKIVGTRDLLSIEWFDP
jgi:hypothetical protein